MVLNVSNNQTMQLVQAILTLGHFASLFVASKLLSPIFSLQKKNTTKRVVI